MPPIAQLQPIALLIVYLLFVPVPIGTDRLSRKIPWVTYGLILVNTAVFCVVVHIGPSVMSAWGLTPRSPRLIALITNIFIHISVMHLLGNMVCLWLSGPSVEDALNHWPFLLFYLGGGVAAGLLHMAIVLIFAPNSTAAISPLVGASGAIAAVLGLYAVRFYRSRIRLYWVAAGFLDSGWGKLELPSLALLALWLLGNLVGAVTSLFQADRTDIAYWAHIGGFIFGMLAADLTGMFGEGTQEYLLADAGAAESRGDVRGDLQAAQSYRSVLEKSPTDEQARTSLGLLVRRYAELQQTPLEVTGPTSYRMITAHRREVFNSISSQYIILIELAIANDDHENAVRWAHETRMLGIEDQLGPDMMMRLARIWVQRREPGQAQHLYHEVIRTFPTEPQAQQAELEVAVLELGSADTSLNAVRRLYDYLDRYSQPTKGFVEPIMAPALIENHYDGSDQ